MISRRVAVAAVCWSPRSCLGGCDKNKEPVFQGWIEADMIFVGPDEAGRIETLSVREGDQVERRAPLFTLDADLQRCRRRHAGSVGEERAACLRPCSDADEDPGRDSEDARRGRGRVAHRAGQAQLGPDATDAPQGVQPGHRPGPADLFPRRRNGAGRQGGGRDAAAGQSQSALLRQRGHAAQAQPWRPGQHSLRRLRRRHSPPRSPSSRAHRNSRRR